MQLPPLTRPQFFCRHASSFLAADPDNVIAGEYTTAIFPLLLLQGHSHVALSQYTAKEARVELAP